jgi:uncharacterized protein with von Willebrand factor type A (vWA) domain
MTHGDGGKGSGQRPTNKEAFDKHFEEIFGRKPPRDVSQELQNQVIDVANLSSDPSFFKKRENK